MDNIEVITIVALHLFFVCATLFFVYVYRKLQFHEKTLIRMNQACLGMALHIRELDANPFRLHTLPVNE